MKIEALSISTNKNFNHFRAKIPNNLRSYVDHKKILTEKIFDQNLSPKILTRTLIGFVFEIFQWNQIFSRTNESV